MRSGSLATRYDATIADPRMRALYGDSGYFNVGYWVDGIRDLPAACGRLVDEIVSAVPPDARTILDVGCGLGAGTLRIASRFPAAEVTGVNVSLWQLRQAHARGVSTAVAADATRLSIGDSTVDAVLAIESAEHFDPREDFFAEAHRVLRPGGVLAMADMLYHEGDAISERMMLPRTRVRTLGQYENALVSAGYADVVVRDVTAQTWAPYCVEMRRVFEGNEDALRGIAASLAHYVLAFARRR